MCTLPPLLQAIMDLFRLVCCKDGSDLLGIGGTTPFLPDFLVQTGKKR
jgi:hypothetical protein